MKSLFYVLAIVAVGAAGFFGWSAKEKYTEQLAARDELIGKNERLSANIEDKNKEKELKTSARDLALNEEAEAEQGLKAAVAKAGELQRTMDAVNGELEIAAAREKEIDESVAQIRAKFPDTELEDVPKVYQEMVDKQKKLIAEKEEAELIKTKLGEDVARNLAETSRVTEKINESISRVAGNTFQATVTAVDNDWNFVVIGAGEKSGLSGDSKLLVVRSGRLLGKLNISKLEANSAVADVEPGSLKSGVALQPGDQVILEKVRSN